MRYRLNLFLSRVRAAVYLLLRFPHKARRFRQLSEAPIVIGGCGRSGTTLLLSLMSCHAEVLAINDETGGLCPRRTQSRSIINFPIRMWRIYTALNRIPIHPEARRWCEKTPRNVRNFDAILDYFGSSVRLLVIVRDCRDVITSYHPRNTRPYLTPDEWLADVELGRRYENHPQVMTLRYEDLIADMPGMMRKICAFAGLDYVADFERFPETARIGELNSEQKPISQDSLEKWRQPKNAEKAAEVLADPRCRAMLEYYGYPLS